MSKSQTIAFFEEISKNQQLAQEVEKVVGGKTSNETKAKELLSLAKNHGFNFTKEEAASAQRTLKTSLSPEEMLEVSGGKINLKASVMALALLTGLGVGGTTMSNMETSAMKRTFGSKHRISDFTRPTQRQPVGATNSMQNETPRATQPGESLFAAVMRHAQNLQPMQPATTGTTNLTQNETPDGNSQEAQTRNTPEQKGRKSEEHDKKAAKRFGSDKGCSGQFLLNVRGRSGNGHLPNAVWPAVPLFKKNGDGKSTCRYCAEKLTMGNNSKDPYCKNPECIFPWVFRRIASDDQSSQRSIASNAYARWVLLPALILDSRYNSINSSGNPGIGCARQLTIETPAEAWAVWQLIAWHNNGWDTVRDMMKTHGVIEAKRNEVLRLLEESYNNLVRGNEYLRTLGFGSEVQQLVEGNNDRWQKFIGAMMRHGYESQKAKQAIAMMVHSYNRLTDAQLQDAGYVPTQIPRDLAAAPTEIEAAHQRFEEARRQQARQQQARQQQARQQQAMRTRQELARKTVKNLTLEQRRTFASELKCAAKKKSGKSDSCGHIGAKPKGFNAAGNPCFKCENCKKKFAIDAEEMLDMLQEDAPNPVEMVPPGQNGPQMQMMQENRPTYEIKLSWAPRTQIGRQDMNRLSTQFPPSAIEQPQMNFFNTNQMHNNNNNINNMNNLNNINNNNYDVFHNEEVDFVEDYGNREFYDIDRNLGEPREDQQPIQMMNPNGFGFNFSGQGMNQFNFDQQMQNMQPMNGLSQNNHFVQNQQQISQRNTNQMNDNNNINNPNNNNFNSNTYNNEGVNGFGMDFDDSDENFYNNILKPFLDDEKSKSEGGLQVQIKCTTIITTLTGRITTTKL